MVFWGSPWGWRQRPSVCQAWAAREGTVSGAGAAAAGAPNRARMTSDTRRLFTTDGRLSAACPVVQPRPLAGEDVAAPGQRREHDGESEEVGQAAERHVPGEEVERAEDGLPVVPF